MFRIRFQRAKVCGHSGKLDVSYPAISIPDAAIFPLTSFRAYHWSLTPSFPPGTAKASLLFTKAEN